MEFCFPQKVKIGLGTSQQVGLLAREVGTRALVISEPVNGGGREKVVLGQILERAGVRSLSLEFLEGQNPHKLIKEASTLAKTGFAEMICTLGSMKVLSIGRKLAMELGLPLFELPTNPLLPFLLREEGCLGTGEPSEWEIFEAPLKNPLTILLDPYLATGATPLISVAGFVDMVFLALEASTWAGCDSISRTLSESVLQMWPLAKTVFDQPTKAEYRLDSFFSGLALAQVLAQVPRGPGLTALTILSNITKMPAYGGGGVLLPHFVENYLWKRPGLLIRCAHALGFEGEYSDDQIGAETLAREIRKSLSGFGLPLRFQEMGLIESEISLASEMVRGVTLKKGFPLDDDEIAIFLKGAF